MALDLLNPEQHDELGIWNVEAAWLVARLAEECRPCIDAAWDEDRMRVTLDAASYAVDEGLVVECGGKKFRLRVEAEEIDAPSES
jgi:hypothetical protein